MSNVTVTLEKGLHLDGRPQTEAVLREATVGDIIEAAEEAERPVVTPDGYQLIGSPALTSAHALRRQIVRIGEIAGPIPLGSFKLLSPGDLALLQNEADRLDRAALEAAQRGKE